MSFNDYLDEAKPFHLYISKISPDRKRVSGIMLPILEKIDNETKYHKNYSQVNLRNTLTDLFESIPLNLFSTENQNHLQNTYFLIDCLLLGPILMKHNIKQSCQLITDISKDLISPFIVLHELAVLSWYDMIIPHQIVLDRLESYTMSLKEKYHILGELSLRFPKDCILFEKEKSILDDYYRTRLIKKMKNSRKRALNKDFKIELNLEEVGQLLEDHKFN